MGYGAPMKIYTRTGDAGETGLFGGGRVPKDDLRVQAYGSVDEANAVLGVALAALEDTSLEDTSLEDTSSEEDARPDGGLRAEMERLQRALFDLGADLATPVGARARAKLHGIDDDDVRGLEDAIDRYQTELEPLKHFILPGGVPASASLQLARAVVRRAERETVALAREVEVNTSALRYLNRLSDLLFVLARVANARAGVADVIWTARR